jgi:hypothetical protein
MEAASFFVKCSKAKLKQKNTANSPTPNLVGGARQKHKKYEQNSNTIKF